MNSVHAPLQLRELISPAGLIVTLLLLFLPFLGVSCESGLGTINAETSGWDMAVGGEPSVSRTGVFTIIAPNSSATAAEHAELVDAGVPIQPLMVLTILAILAALLCGLLLRTRFARALGAGIAAGTAVILIILNQIVATDYLIDRMTTDPNDIPRDLATEWVGSRVGFWLTLAILAIMTTYNIVEVAASRRVKFSARWD